MSVEIGKLQMPTKDLLVLTCVETSSHSESLEVCASLALSTIVSVVIYSRYHDACVDSMRYELGVL